ncbi:GNAT family N-acetyltransferase [Szabonella alba]|uniref:GNAT family N-acetyltransferase n=1 Tax=Szabonella alba TaxID=2804194 RepID=A0A8K0V9W1_9RHOB|nr:GNAT family N-acetyltransferase [Szabonella alba]MBL4916040.1 GNAT family N-acetyltransferase [Szabonella alba]
MRAAILRGLPKARIPEAAQIYWDAFGGKLGAVLGPEDQALAFLARTIRPDHCFHAMDDAGRLLGLAGFKSPEGSFAGGSAADLRAVYGRWGGLWRGALLNHLQREVENRRFLLDGICVARPARGQGIGTALMRAVFAEGRARGYGSIRLDVIDANRRARALYERLGFVVLRHDRAGLIGHAFGFQASLAMVRPLGDDDRWP